MKSYEIFESFEILWKCWICFINCEFTLRQPHGVYSGFQHCPTRDEISFPLANQIAKKGPNFPRWKKNQQNSYTISDFKKFQNFNNL
jgi:hypothetical protein